MNKTEFDILYYVYRFPHAEQAEIAANTNLPMDIVVTQLKLLSDKGYLEERHITEFGIQALSPYKISNAIILAAGMSSRFLPFSLEKPKGLITVKGEAMIERQIRQLKEVGIQDITVIVGYMKEKFFYLQEKYGVKLIENKEYAVKNNTSSLMLVLDMLKNTYICASDHYFTKNIFEPYSFRSNYTVKMIHGYSTDYSYELDGDGRFCSMRTYSSNELGLVGPCCFLQKDAEIYANFLRKKYDDPATSSKLWEEVLIDCLQDIELYPRIFYDNVIYEFDNLEELRMFDQSYMDNIDCDIISNICKTLNCSASDVCNIEPVKIGLTNISFKFMCKDKCYIYRHPGEGTSQFLVRECEAYAEQIAKELKLDETFITIDPLMGWKISYFIEDCDYIDPYHAEDQTRAMQMLKTLHNQRIVSKWEFNFIEQCNQYIKIMTEQKLYDFSEYMNIHQQMIELNHQIDSEGFQKVLCHNDTWYWNFLKDKTGKIYLIDWEYAGNAYPAADVADYTISLNFDEDQFLRLAEIYEGHLLNKKETRFYMGNLAIVAWHWFVWGVFKEATGTHVDDLKLWYDKAIAALKKTQELYQ